MSEEFLSGTFDHKQTNKQYKQSKFMSVMQTSKFMSVMQTGWGGGGTDPGSVSALTLSREDTLLSHFNYTLTKHFSSNIIVAVSSFHS